MIGMVENLELLGLLNNLKLSFFGSGWENATKFLNGPDFHRQISATSICRI